MITSIMSGWVLCFCIQFRSCASDVFHWVDAEGCGQVITWVVSSSGAPHIGHEECDCSFHRRRFFPVPQKSAFHLMVSICFNEGREENADEIEFQSRRWSKTDGILSLRIQYFRVGSLVISPVERFPKVRSYFSLFVVYRAIFFIQFQVLCSVRTLWGGI